jgi:hypothetical protein
MIEPFTAAAAILLADRVYDRAARARQRRALLNLLGGDLSLGGEVGEHYGAHPGWYIKVPAATSINEAISDESIDVPPQRNEPAADGITAHCVKMTGRVRAQRRGRRGE